MLLVMEMFTAEDVARAKALLPEAKAVVADAKAAGARRVWVTLAKTGDGPMVAVHTPFVDGKHYVTTLDGVRSVVVESERVRLAGGLARELREQGTPAPAGFDARTLPKLPARFANVLPKGHFLRP